MKGSRGAVPRLNGSRAAVHERHLCEYVPIGKRQQYVKGCDFCEHLQENYRGTYMGCHEPSRACVGRYEPHCQCKECW